MSDQSYYETLGLDESSTFEDIQAARDRLLAQHGEDNKQREAIEAAYDAILMERLRLRQEGKIKVPDRIRFAEKAVEPSSTPKSAPMASTPSWLGQVFDTPDRQDMVQPAIAFVILAVIAVLLGPDSAPLALAFGTGSTIYFLNRKEHRLWRSILLTVVALVIGLGLGFTVGQLLIPQGVELDWATPEAIAALVSFFVFWLVSSFLR